MTFKNWSAFLAPPQALPMVPELTFLLALSYAVRRGCRVAAPVAVGATLGDLTP